MLRLIGRAIASPPRFRCGLLLASGILGSFVGSAVAQDVTVSRTAIVSDMTVRLTNLSTHINYDRAGDAVFIVPVGRYSVQLLRNGQIAYEEVEFLGPNAPDTRMVNPNHLDIVVGLPRQNPQFNSTLCGALEAAAQLTIGNYGLDASQVQSRFRASGSAGSIGSCADTAAAQAASQAVSGSYGAINLAVEFTLLGPQGHLPTTASPAAPAQAITAGRRGSSGFTNSLVSDLKNGIIDAAVDASGRPLLVCAAVDANTPILCDSSGQTYAAPTINTVRQVYRFLVKTTPVDHRGTQTDHWVTFVGEDEYHATQDKLALEARAMQDSLLKRIAQIEAHSVTAPSRLDTSQTTRYYPTPELLALIAATQAEFDQALHDPTLQPLRRHFPATLSTVTKPDQPATPDRDALRAVAELKSAVALLATAAGGLGIDLAFRSAPVETEGTHLAFDACDRCQAITSQGGEHRFYRGKYYVHATLNGYAPYEGWLDFVEDPRTIFECEMVPANRAALGHSSTCALKSQ